MENNNKNTFIAIGLMLLVWVVFTVVFPPTQEPSVEQPPADEATRTEVVASSSSSPAQDVASIPTIIPVVSTEEKELLIKTDLYSAVLTNIGARVKLLELNDYHVENDPDSDLVRIIDVSMPHQASLRLAGVNGLLLSPEAPYSLPEEKEIVLSSDQEKSITLSTRTSDGLLIEKVMTFRGNSYAVDVVIRVSNPGQVATRGGLEFSLVQVFDDSAKPDRLSFVGGAALVNDEVQTASLDDLAEESVSYGKATVWTAYEDKYFMSALVPLENALEKVRIQRQDERVENIISLPGTSLSPGSSTTHTFMAYFGPRDMKVLEQVNHQLSKAIDFGFFSIISDPLLWFLNFINTYVHNYGIAIILLTVLIKTLFWPLTHKSYASMKAMQKLQPEIAKIRERFKNDRTRQGQETMEMYKKHRVNPMSGCLPMLIQIPVFFALYRVLYEAIELRHADFAFWLTDLSAKDPYYITPVVMGVTMFIQQRMTPSTMDPTQQKIFLAMPVVFTALFLNFPSGLVIYWLINNLLTIAQQYYIHKKFS
ncbi:MAG: protein translocase component YidC [Desulfuromonas sp.]|mgnify:CR=1 FL=1|nr:MAG: protein translocase component YidC [Desulfuromonas sp.]